MHLYSVVPHAHYLCREFRLAATLPDGTIQPLLWITDWDIDWQDQYRYVKPVAVAQGHRAHLGRVFRQLGRQPRNPHRPPRRVRYGIETEDEMCACHLEFLPDDPSGYAAYPSSRRSACEIDRSIGQRLGFELSSSSPASSERDRERPSAVCGAASRRIIDARTTICERLTVSASRKTSTSVPVG